MQIQANSKLLILTENPAGFRGFFERLYRRIARPCKTALFHLWPAPRFLPYGGPGAVVASLLRGLGLRGVTYSLNRKVAADTVCVLANADALRFAIQGKERGFFKKIIAGPNVVHNPSSANGLICHPAIDAIIVPSQWNRDWWTSLAPELAPKMHPWPGGVSTSIPSSSRTGGAIVYVKNPCPFLAKIVATATSAGLNPQVFRYGTFTHNAYLAALKTARLVIYCSQTESQGIALSEAWMADVPTLVWNPGFFEIGEYSWKDAAMSAPYLSREAGTFFSNESEYAATLAAYLAQPSQYNPRAYCVKNLSDEATTDRYLSIAGLK